MIAPDLKSYDGLLDLLAEAIAREILAERETVPREPEHVEPVQ